MPRTRIRLSSTAIEIAIQMASVDQ